MQISPELLTDYYSNTDSFLKKPMSFISLFIGFIH